MDKFQTRSIHVIYGLLSALLCLITSALWSQKPSDSLASIDKAAEISLLSKTQTRGSNPDVFTDSGLQRYYQTANTELNRIRNVISSPGYTDQGGTALRTVATTVFGPDIVKTFSKNERPVMNSKTNHLLSFGGGYIGYNWNYRSALDTPFAQLSLSQHLISASGDFTVADFLPLHISYFGRETNSPYFKSYRDLRVDIDIQRLQMLRTKAALAYFKDRLKALQNPEINYGLNTTANKLVELQNVTNDPYLVKRFIQSREIILRTTFADTSTAFKDSVHRSAARFLSIYDSLHTLQNRYTFFQDSLQRVVQQNEAKVRRLESLVNKTSLTPQEVTELARLYGRKDQHIQKLIGTFDGIKQFSIGRMSPSYSNLTLQNVAVNGVNVEYSKRKFYAALAAGSVDFRYRDFLSETARRPSQQAIYFTRIGYGHKDGNFIALSYFRGKKQLFTSAIRNSSASVQGAALSMQVYLARYIKLYGELAQSAAPGSSNNASNTGKSNLRFDDASQQAYAFGLTTELPSTHTRINSYYQKTGIDYQCFNSFQYNTTLNSWSARVEQPFWKQQFVLVASIRKNDFANPYVLQRYNANTVFKTASLTFRKRKWPVLSIGYLPVAQNAVVGNQVYENHFQAFTGSLNYHYAIGLAKAFSTVMYSQFYNESSDSSYIYFNSKNIYWNQSFVFDLYTASVGASVMVNNQYKLTVLEGGVSSVLFQKFNLDFSVKVNHLQSNTTKFGFRTGGRFTLKGIGELNFWTEKSYLPTMQNALSKYEMYNLGLTRFFK